jgi:hypothetical protein
VVSATRRESTRNLRSCLKGRAIACRDRPPVAVLPSVSKGPRLQADRRVLPRYVAQPRASTPFSMTANGGMSIASRRRRRRTSSARDSAASGSISDRGKGANWARWNKR